MYQKYEKEFLDKLLKEVPTDFQCPNPEPDRLRKDFVPGFKTAIIVLASITIAVSIVIIIYILLNLQKTSVKNTKPKYALASLCGALLIYSYIILRMIEPSYDFNSDNDLGKIHCNFNRWTFYLGLVMFIVPITVRLRAINNIFAKVDKKLLTQGVS